MAGRLLVYQRRASIRRRYVVVVDIRVSRRTPASNVSTGAPSRTSGRLGRVLVLPRRPAWLLGVSGRGGDQRLAVQRVRLKVLAVVYWRRSRSRRVSDRLEVLRTTSWTVLLTMQSSIYS